MKICIVSDSHDRADELARAVGVAKAEGAEAVIHCGDLIGAQTIKPALAHGLPTHLIHGNNVGDTQALHRLVGASDGRLRYHGVDARIELGGRKVFLVHYDDYGYAMAPDAKLTDEEQRLVAPAADLAIVGTKSWINQDLEAVLARDGGEVRRRLCGRTQTAGAGGANCRGET